MSWEPLLALRRAAGERRALPGRAQDQTEPRTDRSGVSFSRNPELAARAALSDRWGAHLAVPRGERTYAPPGEVSPRRAPLHRCPGWLAYRDRDPDARGDRFVNHLASFRRQPGPTP